MSNRTHTRARLLFMYVFSRKGAKFECFNLTQALSRNVEMKDGIRFEIKKKVQGKEAKDFEGRGSLNTRRVKEV